jgi:hypothetical protein
LLTNNPQAARFTALRASEADKVAIRACIDQMTAASCT